MKPLVPILVLALVAGCGHKGALTRVPPRDDMTEEELRAARARDEAETAAGLRLAPESLVIRQDDALANTRETLDDPFQLPPP
jgi:predicted small lipoprotein YifL